MIEKSKFEPEIEQLIQINKKGIFYKGICIESDLECDNCMLRKFPSLCLRTNCKPRERKDKKNIIVKELEG